MSGALKGRILRLEAKFRPNADPVRLVGGPDSEDPAVQEKFMARWHAEHEGGRFRLVRFYFGGFDISEV